MENRTFSILGEVWELKYADHINIDEKPEREYTQGVSDLDNSVIAICNLKQDGRPRSPKERKQTLLHELFHAILKSGMYTDEGCNEKLVEWLARCTYDLLEQGVI